MKKRTRYSADAFIVTTKFNIAASKQLHEMHNFRSLRCFRKVLLKYLSVRPGKGRGQLLHRHMRRYSSIKSTISSSTY